MNIVVMNGANAMTSRLTGLVNYIEQSLTQQQIKVGRLDVISIPAEDLILTKFGSPAIIEARSLVEAADVLFIATPVYKGSYSGILKTFLDLLPERALQGKTCIPIAMGGTVAHLLMLEYTLKPVLSILGATAIEHGVYAIDKQVTVQQDDVVIDDELLTVEVAFYMREEQKFPSLDALVQQLHQDLLQTRYRFSLEMQQAGGM